MPCPPRYTVTPGTEKMPATFGTLITLAAVGGGFGNPSAPGTIPGTVSLVCADGKESSLPVVSWQDAAVTVTLMPPQQTPCLGPYQISVLPSGTPKENACKEPIVIASQDEEGSDQEAEPWAVQGAVLLGVGFLGSVAIVCLIILGILGGFAHDPGNSSPVNNQQEKTMTTQATGQGKTVTEGQIASQSAASASTLGLLGQISSVVGTVAAAAVGGIAGLLVRPGRPPST